VPFFFLKSQETFVSKDNSFNVGNLMSRAKGIFHSQRNISIEPYDQKLDKIELHQRPKNFACSQMPKNILILPHFAMNTHKKLFCDILEFYLKKN